MSTIGLLLFGFGAACILYTYVGYPLFLLVLSVFCRPDRSHARQQPRITVVISAYNEGKVIAEKIQDLWNSSYPKDKLQIIVGSDGSTDNTDEVVKRYASESVCLVRVEGRQGKTAVQNRCVEFATGEIIVFSDATTEIPADGLLNIVRYFTDDAIGCVAGRLQYQSKNNELIGQGGVSYWDYELAIRRLESRVSSLIGVSGCFYAVRKCAYRPLEVGSISDLAVALDMYDRGYRTVLAEEAICYENALDLPRDEFQMRVRVALRSIRSLLDWRKMMNPFCYGIFSIQLFSHKVLRYLVGGFSILCFLGNILVLKQPVFQFTFIIQISFYLLAAYGLVRHRNSDAKIFTFPAYFVLVNLAAMFAIVKALRGKDAMTWETVR